MLAINNISLQLGNKLLFDNASVTLFSKQKIGIIGANGCGKSTLFSLILGLIKPDDGELTIPTGLRIAHLSQETPALAMSAIEYVKQGDTELVAIENELQHAEKIDDANKIAELHAKLYAVDGYTAHARAAQIMDGLGFLAKDFTAPVKSFSGGWRMRLNLAQTLMCRSDILLLDEPTNHLDLDAILWFEHYLQSYSGTLLIISHDREFLDAVVTRIIHVDQRQFKSYTSNYSEFEKLRAEQLALQQLMYEKQQKQIAHMMSYVNRFRYKATKAKQAQSRLKAIDRLETVMAVQAALSFQFEFKSIEPPAYPLLSLRDISVSYQDKIILQHVNLNIAPTARIGLLGTNGAGKSSLIKLLAGELPFRQGEYISAKGLKIGYYAQHQLEQLITTASPLQHLQKLSPLTSEQQLRNFLGGFAFSAEMALTPITHFSGGEKARLALALLVWQAPHLLLLDEPTNHLDLDMRNALTLAMQTFTGAVIIVSHDRYLLRTTVDEFLLVDSGQVKPFTGNLEDYEQWLVQNKKQQQIATKPTVGYKPQLESHKLAAQLQRIETELDKLQNQLQEIETALADPGLYSESNDIKLGEYIKKRAELIEKITQFEDRWEQLYQQIEGS